jgi:MFS family permease
MMRQDDTHSPEGRRILLEPQYHEPQSECLFMPYEIFPQRWRILALLFLVRMTMAIQFQMVAALSPVIESTFAVTLADVGILIGLYFTPGILIAAPGGALGRHFGEKQVVLAGLALMLIGGAMMSLSGAWSMQLSGRLVSGVGGVFLNVLLTKMVADWFAGREISLAMAVFVNSWPVGIAVALIGLPMVAISGGLTLTMGVVMALIVVAFLGLLLIYRAPQDHAQAGVVSSGKVQGALFWAVLTAGAIWGIYNAALAIVFSFGPQLFVSRGMGLAEAGYVTSLVLWCLAIMGPIAGHLADRSGRRLLIIAIGNLSFAFFVMLGAIIETSVLCVIAIGLSSGVAVGAMVSLPSLILPPAARAVGMGIFFTVYYACIAAGPMMAGVVSEWVSLAATFHLAAVLLVITAGLLPFYHWLSVRVSASAANPAAKAAGV